jgi:hypothetical protein
VVSFPLAFSPITYNYNYLLLYNYVRRTDHVTPLYLQKLVLTSPTTGGRSVGIVRLRTKATGLVI